MSDNHYAYIHILPKNTGDSYEREIVPANSIRKLDYEQYKNDVAYKKECFRFKRSEDGPKLKCYVLYAADSYAEVKEYIEEAKRKNKRFRIPKNVKEFNESSSINNDSTISAELPDTAERTSEINVAKSKRKACKQLQKENKKVKAASLIHDYINAKVPNDEVFESENALSQSSMEDRDVDYTSTPIRERTDNLNNINSNMNSVAMGYKMQIDHFKSEAAKWKSKYEKLKNEIQENPAVVCNANDDDSYALAEYDRIYNLSYTQENRPQYLDSKDEMLVTLRKGIKCNSLAYKHAYTSTKPSDFISTISKGIYGKKNLAERCVRKQKNTADKEELDSVTTEIIDEEFYNYLRVKRFTLKQIEGELEKLNKHHHNSISIARKQVAQDKENEVDETLERLRKEHQDKEKDKTVKSTQVQESTQNTKSVEQTNQQNNTMEQTAQKNNSRSLNVAENDNN